jgi:hypothetical protein
VALYLNIFGKLLGSKFCLMIKAAPRDNVGRTTIKRPAE